jgi:phage shock protein E
MKKLTRLLAWTLLLQGAGSYAEEQPHKAMQWIDQGALVIDVRTAQEYGQAHLPRALHIPYQRIVAQLARLEIAKERPLVLYCRSGGRAGIAEQALRQAGYSQIVNGGGYEDLQAP